MPDTPGKRQRREVKARRRQAKDERRTTRNLRRDDPVAALGGVQLLDENGFPVYDDDGYPVIIPQTDTDAEQPESLGDEASVPDETG